MNDMTPSSGNPSPASPAAPPVIPGGSAVADSADHVPIHGVLAATEAILRQPRRVIHQLCRKEQGGLIARLVAITLVCCVVYGLVVGTFSGGQQLWAAPLKIALGLVVSGLICLPSLYIFSCLSGSQARLVEVFGLVAGLLALTSILLIGFAPVAWVFSQSTQSVTFMGALHLVFWVVATAFGLRFLYTGLAHAQAKSEGAFHVWVIIFLLVALQMTTSLRPIIGTSVQFLPAATEKKFFLVHWFDCLDAQPVESSRATTPRQ